jgi:hypothetical protein
MRILRSSTLALILSGCSIETVATFAHAQSSINIVVSVAPPPIPIYEQPPLPGEGFIWAPGYWAWDQSQSDYFWVPATWVQAPEPNLLWTPGYWGWNNASYVFYPGYWASQVGFYGGINYGYGYAGSGYQGGRWQSGAFFYNSAVNNVGSVAVTNVYNETVVVKNTTDNISYNGGTGGIQARATPQEQAAAKQEHVAATQLQTQQVEAARKNRALFSKENRGEPAIAATPRAGMFEGKGVIQATHATGEPKTEPVKAESKAESTNPEPPKTASKPEPAMPAKAEPKVEPSNPEPARAEAKPEAAKPVKEESKVEHPSPNPAKAESKPEQVKPEPMMIEPQTEPAKLDPTKAEPKTEQPRPETKAEVPRPPAQKAGQKAEDSKDK